MTRVRRAAALLAVALVLSFARPPEAQVVPPEEQALFEAAQVSGLPADFVTYLLRYPEGTYAAAARFELQLAGVAPPPPPQTDITFTTPLAQGADGVKGRSIKDLLTTGTPLFSPIDGLPDEVWKDKPCTTCHQWTAADLCEQGRTLNRPEMADRLALPHPFGPEFKLALRAFSTGGCRAE